MFPSKTGIENKTMIFNGFPEVISLVIRLRPLSNSVIVNVIETGVFDCVKHSILHIFGKNNSFFDKKVTFFLFN